MNRFTCLKVDNTYFYPDEINKWIIDMFKHKEIVYINDTQENKYLHKINKHNELVWITPRNKRTSC